MRTGILTELEHTTKSLVRNEIISIRTGLKNINCNRKKGVRKIVKHVTQETWLENCKKIIEKTKKTNKIKQQKTIK